MLGIVQGATEFLPISSTAHLIIVPWLLGWSDPGLTHNVALHMGTLSAVIFYFRGDIVSITGAFLKALLGGGGFSGNGRAKLGLFIIIGTLPGIAAGLLFESQASQLFRHPIVLGTTLALFGILLYVADRRGGKRRTLDDMGIVDCLAFGLMQALSIVPGVSRAGITITGGLFRGYRREEAARFSFLLGVPIMAGAGVLEARHMELVTVLSAEFTAGLLASAIVGFMSIKYLMSYVSSRDYGVFTIYRVALAGVIFAIYGLTR